MPWSWVNTEYSIHRVQHTLCTAYTVYSIHPVLYPPSTVSPQNCLSYHHSHHYELTAECSFSFRRAFLQDRPPPASSPWEIIGKVTSSYSHCCQWTNWWIESRHPAGLLSTGSKYSSNLARPWPSSASLSYTIVASKCISKLRSITASKCVWEIHNLGPQVHLQTHSIKAPKFTPSWAPLGSPNSLNLGLQMHLCVHSIMASQSFCKLSWSRPPRVSLSSHNNRFQRYLWVHLIVIFRRTKNCSQVPPVASPAILVCRWEAI